MKTTRKKGVNGIVTLTISDDMYDLLDEFKSDMQTPHEKLNGIELIHSQQILRIVSTYLIMKKEKNERVIKD